MVAQDIGTLKDALSDGFKYIFKFFTGDVYVSRHKPVFAFGDYHFNPLDMDGGSKRVDIEFDGDMEKIRSLIGCVNYDESGKYAVGDKIVHKNFGVGVITDIKSYGSPVALVDFESVGVKRLALEFAPIETVA